MAKLFGSFPTNWGNYGDSSESTRAVSLSLLVDRRALDRSIGMEDRPAALLAIMQYYGLSEALDACSCCG